MSAVDDIPEAEVIEEAAAPVASLEVARRERRSEVIKPLDAEALVESFKEYQELLPKLLDASDYQQAGDKKFVKKSGWLKIARAFDLDTELAAPVVIERDHDGKPIRAQVWIRAIAPSGAAMVGDGYCSIDEDRFSKPSGRKKLEHDLPSTAATRARNRAISNLVGMGEVSAEEMGSGGSTEPALPFGPEAPSSQIAAARNAIGYLLTETPGADAVTEIVNAIEKAAGYLPHFTLARISIVAAAVRDRENAGMEAASV